MGKNKLSSKKRENILQNILFFNRWAKNYDLSIFKFWMRQFQKPVYRIISNKKNLRILDISCGTGELLKALQEKNKRTELYGIDISTNMLSIAKKKLPESVKLVKADVHKIPFQKNFFDYTITTEAFHHYYNQKKAIIEMTRVTKNNGEIIVIDVNFYLRFIHWLFEKIEPGCVKVNTRKEMKVLFQQAGIKNIEQKRNFVFSVMTVGKKV
ncbi:MAG TPA: methyltransferase domain-containing protein [Candidatus Nanoarchaeia archaeon]|nr:methyltransferase domain-containing protein [Candidatus Nanoarchaeia archaeon]